MSSASSPSPQRTGGVAVVVVAAGRGERAGLADGPKQFRRLAGRTILARTLDAFLGHPEIGRIVLVTHSDDDPLLEQALDLDDDRLLRVHGGSTRQASVRNGLEALREDPPSLVLIQDGVRPFVDAAVIDRVIAVAASGTGALPALAISDTLKRSGVDGTVSETVPRRDLFAAQTPQGFPFAAILDAHRLAAREQGDIFTDDASIAEWAGMPVRLVAGSPDNVKITWARDIALADARLSSSTFPDVRVGNGYDVHAFGQGDHVTLAGVAIPHEKGLCGHSDADVALHALTDALLATCGAGDIGTHFPPSDPQWRGAASSIFVAHAAAIVRGMAGRIANADVTLICEAPRIGPHRGAMVAAISAMLGVGEHRVSVKATTNETLGFIGRREGIAAIATATVVFPGELLP